MVMTRQHMNRGVLAVAAQALRIAKGLVYPLNGFEPADQDRSRKWLRLQEKTLAEPPPLLDVNTLRRSGFHRLADGDSLA